VYGDDEEPPCESCCCVGLAPENRTTWKLYDLCRDQKLSYEVGDGKIAIRLDHKAVIETLRIYGEDNREMFELILFCWNVEQGLNT